MWTMTGFADEISPDLDEQIALLTKLGVKHVEFRSAWDTKILDFTPEQLQETKDKLDAAGITLSSVGSDLGKILITDSFEPHLERTKHAIEVARFFGAKYIRIFSFFIPEGEDPAQYRDEVIARTRAMVEVAEGTGVTLLHENEKDIYGDVPSRVHDLLSAIDSPVYRAIFDPANYAQCEVHPMDEAYELVRPYLEYVHCKDAKFPVNAEDLGEVTPCGQGDGQWPEFIAALRDSGFDGYFSLEPHLGDLTSYGAVSGAEHWELAYNALQDLFRAAGVESD